MDEHQGPSSRENSLAEETTRALDALRARSSTLRADEAEKWNDLEARLNDSIRTVEEEMARSLDAAASQQADVHNAAANLVERERAFEAIQTDIQGEQQELAEYLQEQQNRLTRLEQELIEREKLVALSELAQQETEGDREEIVRTRERVSEKEQTLDTQQEQLAADRKRLQEQRQNVAARLAEQREKQQTEIKHERAELDDRRVELEKQQADLLDRGQCLEQKSAELEQKEAELAEQMRVLDARDEQLAEQGQQLEQKRDAEDVRIGELEELLRDRDAALAELREQNARIESDLAAALQAVELSDETAERLVQVEQQRAALIAERDSLSQERADLQNELDLATSTRDRLADALAEAEEKIETAEEKLAAQPDPTELEQKFELAMEEARDLRAKNAELEERLAAQTDRLQVDSPELADLRAERDALATRIAELEQLPPTSSDESLEQQFDDLQRRFELAVDDVRELKTEKADLEKQLAEARSGSNAALADDGALDWEAQKRKLLKSLDEDFDTDDEEDRQSRVTIEGTIHITDNVIAEKDREIAEFKRLLDEQSSSIGDVAIGAAAVAELFDQDDAVRQERERLVALQAELQGKLRDAELELSVQRAKLAREQSEVNNRQQELEEQQAALERASDDDTDGTGKRKRQWLVRLGLNKE